ncbi:MAG: ABC transporter ATP-binding protein [Oscillospiraceae bacterium]|nr:ABC transporter ATP-binding protein [Oscillospiraceae bacterium]
MNSLNNEKQRSPFSWIWEFAGEHKPVYGLSVAFAAAGVVCGILPYFFVGDIVKKLLDGIRDIDVYTKSIIIIVFLWAGRCIFHSISTSLSHKATFTVLGNIRKRCCEKLSRVPLGYVLDTPSGSLKNIMVERVDTIETTMAHIVPEFTSNLLVPLGLLVYLFALDWRMALASLVTIPIGLIFFGGMMKDYEVNYQNAINKTKALNDTAVEYIGGIEVIKAFGKAQSSYEKFVVAAKEGADCYIEWMRGCNLYFNIALAVFPATMLSILPIGGLLYKGGTLEADVFVQVIILSVGLIASLVSVMSYKDDIARLGTIIGEVTGIITQPELERPEKTAAQPKNYGITLENVTFGYHEKEVLHGIDMEIKEGTVNAFVGPSGSGKSTIAKLIASLWDVKSGSIKIGGTDIREISSEEYNKMIAYVSQDNFLFDQSVMENIRMGRQGATDDEVVEAAKKCGCHDFIMQLEKGYDTLVGGAGGHLSGGERQRISIARAMLKNAPIVILDEATAYTDPENEALIQSSVARLVKGKTLIVIAHRLSTITDSDRIFVIKNGKVNSSGTHGELLRQNGLYADMWNAHISVKDTAGGEV